MKIVFDNIFIAEGDLRKYPTEDGYTYLPDYIAVVDVGNVTYEHPHYFKSESSAMKFMNEVKRHGYIRTDIWREYNPEFRYSNGNDEPFDEEELNRRHSACY